MKNNFPALIHAKRANWRIRYVNLITVSTACVYLNLKLNFWTTCVEANRKSTLFSKMFCTYIDAFFSPVALHVRTLAFLFVYCSPTDKKLQLRKRNQPGSLVPTQSPCMSPQRVSCLTQEVAKILH